MKRKWWIVLIVIVAVLGLLIYGMNQRANEGIEVKTDMVKKGDVVSYFSTSGTVESQNKREYYVQDPTVKVLKVYVNVGDRVKKGQVIASFDVQDMTNQLKTAKLQLDSARLQLKALEKQKSDAEKAQSTTGDLEGIQGLKGQNIDLKSQQQNIDYDSQIKLQKNQVEIARLNVQSIQDTISKQQKYIKSDIDGIVTALNLKEGSPASAQGAAVTVEDTSNLKVDVNVNQIDVSRLKLNQEAIIRFNDKNFKGIVSHIDPTATKTISESGSDTGVKTEVKLTQNDGTIKSGFEVDIDIKTGERKNVLKVPAEAIITNKYNQETVYVVENNTAKLVKVKTGLSSDTEVEVLEGLKEGQRVILNPTGDITNGTIIKGEKTK